MYICIHVYICLCVLYISATVAAMATVAFDSHFDEDDDDSSTSSSNPFEVARVLFDCVCTHAMLRARDEGAMQLARNGMMTLHQSHHSFDA